MTIRSVLWETAKGVGDGQFVYTEENAHDMMRYFDVIDPTVMGVVARNGEELQVTVNGSNFEVGTGKAYINGLRYRNTATVQIGFGSAASDTGFAIALRATYSTRTVAAVLKISASGVTDPPAMVQNSTQWEIPLAQGVVDINGDVWTDATKATSGVKDTRHFAVSPLASMVKLRTFEPTVNTATHTFENIQQSLTHLMLVGYGRAVSNQRPIQVLPNGDTTAANYVGLRVQLQTSSSFTITFDNPPSSANAGVGAYFTNSSHFRDAFKMFIPSYTNGNLNKLMLSSYGAFVGGTGTMGIHKSAQYWVNTDAITSLRIRPQSSDSFDANETKIELWGIV